MDRDKSSKRSRDYPDRDSTRVHRHQRDRDDDHHMHRRDRDVDEKRRDSDRHHHRHRSDHRSSRLEDRESSLERSHDRRDERQESRDRVRDRELKRERSHEARNERENSREREGSEEGEKVREGSFEDMEGKNGKKRERDDVSGEGRGEKRPRRRFEPFGVREEAEERVVEVVKAKEAVNYDAGAVLGAARVANGSTQDSDSVASVESPLAPNEPPSIKVSSISTANENKGVSVTRSHEVPGKSSTDGTSSAAGKSSGNLYLDALAKAKKALQMQKELAEKLKKIPLLKSSGSTLDGSSHTGVPGSYPSSTTTSATSAVASSLPAATVASVKPFPSAPGLAGLGTIPNIEAVKRAQELAAKMGFRQDPEFAPLINLFPGQMPTEATAPQKPTKAPVLRVDALGREIDEHGNIVNLTKPSNLSTLKVNINKQKKDAFQILKPQLDVDPESNPHFDPRMGINKNKLLRTKRMTFQFVDEGKWSKEAEMQKLKSQFGEAKAKELKAKQAQLAKAKADINPNLIEVSERVITKEKPKDPIPNVEWWDVSLLINGSYGDMADGSITEDKMKLERITAYVEHPRPIEPPAEPAPPPPQPLKLTKKEQKKLRTQRRLAREKERQEMIRQGLLEPPKPKVKMSNLMKVLGSEATQDPTRLEKEIHTAAAEREQAHIDRNTARKLTPAERREKKERKLFDDPSTTETIVSVYRINELSHPKARFKVDMNARENRLTGCAVISDGMTVVVVEGGSKSIKRYGKLMLRRINWTEAVKVDEEDEEEEEEDKPVNNCVLVWQGSVAKSSFYRFHIHECVTEAAARKVFVDAGVGHYWDLAVNYSEE